MAQNPMQKIDMKLGMHPNATTMIKTHFLNANTEKTATNYDYFYEFKGCFLMYF